MRSVLRRTTGLAIFVVAALAVPTFEPASADERLTISQPNEGQVFNAEVGQELTVQVAARSNQRVRIQLSAVRRTLPTGAQFRNAVNARSPANGLLRFTPGLRQAGQTFNVTVVAQVPALDLAVERTFRVRVHPSTERYPPEDEHPDRPLERYPEHQDAPQFQSPDAGARYAAIVGRRLVVPIEVVAHRRGSVTVWATAGLPEGATLERKRGRGTVRTELRFTPHASQVGLWFSIVIEARDREGRGARWIVRVVVAEGRSRVPLFLTPRDGAGFSVEVGELLEVPIKATLPAGGWFTLRAAGELPAGAVLADVTSRRRAETVLRFTPLDAQDGERLEIVIEAVTRAGERATTRIVVGVGVPAEPELPPLRFVRDAPEAEILVAIGSTARVPYRAESAPGLAIDIQPRLRLPDGARIDTTHGTGTLSGALVFRPQASQVGRRFTVVLEAVDGVRRRAQIAFTLVVTKAAPRIEAPEERATYDVEVGATLRVEIRAQGEGRGLVFLRPGGDLPLGMRFPISGAPGRVTTTLVFTPTEAQAGNTYDIAIEARGDDGATGVRRIQIRVGALAVSLELVIPRVVARGDRVRGTVVRRTPTSETPLPSGSTVVYERTRVRVGEGGTVLLPPIEWPPGNYFIEIEQPDDQLRSRPRHVEVIDVPAGTTTQMATASSVVDRGGLLRVEGQALGRLTRFALEAEGRSPVALGAVVARSSLEVLVRVGGEVPDGAHQLVAYDADGGRFVAPRPSNAPALDVRREAGALEVRSDQAGVLLLQSTAASTRVSRSRVDVQPGRSVRVDVEGDAGAVTTHFVSARDAGPPPGATGLDVRVGRVEVKSDDSSSRGSDGTIVRAAVELVDPSGSAAGVLNASAVVTHPGGVEFVDFQTSESGAGSITTSFPGTVNRSDVDVHVYDVWERPWYGEKVPPPSACTVRGFLSLVFLRAANGEAEDEIYPVLECTDPHDPASCEVVHERNQEEWTSRAFTLVSTEPGEGCPESQYLLRVLGGAGSSMTSVDNPRAASFEGTREESDCKPCDGECESVTPFMDTGTIPGPYETRPELCEPELGCVLSEESRGGAFWVSKLDAHGEPTLVEESGDRTRQKFPDYAEALPKRSGSVFEPVIQMNWGGIRGPQRECALYGVGIKVGPNQAKRDCGPIQNRWNLTAVARDPVTGENLPAGYSIRWRMSDFQYERGSNVPLEHVVIEEKRGQPETIEFVVGPGRWFPRLEVWYTAPPEPSGKPSAPELVGIAEIHSLAVEAIETQPLPARGRDADPKIRRGSAVLVTNHAGGLDVDARLSISGGEAGTRGRVSIDGYPQNEYWAKADDGYDLRQAFRAPDGRPQRAWLQGYGAASRVKDDLQFVSEGQAFLEACGSCDGWSFQGNPVAPLWQETDREPFSAIRVTWLAPLAPEAEDSDPLDVEFGGVSDPRPTVVLAPVGTVTASGESIEVPIRGEVFDAIADHVPRGFVSDGRADPDEVVVRLGTRELARVPLTPGDGGAPTFWRPHPYRGSFDAGTVEVPARGGPHELVIETTGNAIGNTGFAVLEVDADLVVVPGGSPAPSTHAGSFPLTIELAALLDPSRSDRLTATVGPTGASVTLDEPADARDGRVFVSGTDGTSLHRVVIERWVRRDGAPDVLVATLSGTAPNGVALDFSAPFVESAPGSLRFEFDYRPAQADVLFFGPPTDDGAWGEVDLFLATPFESMRRIVLTRLEPGSAEFHGEGDVWTVSGPLPPRMETAAVDTLAVAVEVAWRDRTATRVSATLRETGPTTSIFRLDPPGSGAGSGPSPVAFSTWSAEAEVIGGNDAGPHNPLTLGVQGVHAPFEVEVEIGDGGPGFPLDPSAAGTWRPILGGSPNIGIVYKNKGKLTALALDKTGKLVGKPIENLGAEADAVSALTRRKIAKTGIWIVSVDADGNYDRDQGGKTEDHAKESNAVTIASTKGAVVLVNCDYDGAGTTRTPDHRDEKVENKKDDLSVVSVLKLALSPDFGPSRNKISKADADALAKSRARKARILGTDGRQGELDVARAALEARVKPWIQGYSSAKSAARRISKSLGFQSDDLYAVRDRLKAMIQALEPTYQGFVKPSRQGFATEAEYQQSLARHKDRVKRAGRSEVSRVKNRYRKLLSKLRTVESKIKSYRNTAVANLKAASALERRIKALEQELIKLEQDIKGLDKNAPFHEYQERVKKGAAGYARITVTCELEKPTGDRFPKVAAHHRFRVFGPDGEVLLGPRNKSLTLSSAQTPDPKALDFWDLVGSTGQVDLHAEALRPGMGAILTVRVEVQATRGKKTYTATSKDAVALFGAPFTGQSPDAKVRAIFWGAHFSDKVFGPSLTRAMAAIGGGVRLIPNGGWPWPQDAAQPGFLDANGRKMGAAMRLHGGADLPAADVGWFQTGGHVMSLHNDRSMPYTRHQGGNLECVPAVQGTYPNGAWLRFSGNPKHETRFQTFLDHQTTQQKRVEVDPGPLPIEHIDEVIAVLPKGGALAFAIGDLDLAIKVLTGLPARTALPGGKAAGKVLAELTTDKKRVAAYRLALAHIEATLRKHFGKSVKIEKVPVCYGERDVRIPNAVNLVLVNGHLLVPDQTATALNKEVAAALGRLGFGGGAVHLVDTTVHHAHRGNAHCATLPIFELP